MSSYTLFACAQDQGPDGMQSSALRQGSPSFLDISDEPTALPLKNLIGTLRDKARTKLAPRGLALPISATYAACGETTTIPGTHLCIFNNDGGMNFALNRASHWIEEKEMVDHNGLQNLNWDMNVQGHNLAGKDLREFAKAYGQTRANFDGKVPPLAVPSDRDDLGNGLGIEREFWSRFLGKKLDSTPNFYLIAVTFSGINALNHEILHAVYFNSAELQEVVREFWLKELSRDARKAIIEDLAGTGAYHVGDDDPDAPSFLLLNEFQAYVLMHREPFDDATLEGLARKYKDRLSKRVAERGIQLPDTSSPALPSLP